MVSCIESAACQRHQEVDDMLPLAEVGIAFHCARAWSSQTLFECGFAIVSNAKIGGSWDMEEMQRSGQDVMAYHHDPTCKESVSHAHLR